VVRNDCVLMLLKKDVTVVQGEERPADRVPSTNPTARLVAVGILIDEEALRRWLIDVFLYPNSLTHL
jgi:hypothetical protein